MRYKVWVEIEEIDDDADHYERYGEPIDVAVFDDPGAAEHFRSQLAEQAELLGGLCPHGD